MVRHECMNERKKERHITYLFSQLVCSRVCIVCAVYLLMRCVSSECTVYLLMRCISIECAVYLCIYLSTVTYLSYLSKCLSRVLEPLTSIDALYKIQCHTSILDVKMYFTAYLTLLCTAI